MELFKSKQKLQKFKPWIIGFFILIGLIIFYTPLVSFTDFVKKATILNQENKALQKMSAYKSSCGFVPYLNIATNPNKFKYKRIKFTGTVNQVIYSKTELILIISIEKNFLQQPHMIYVNYKIDENEDQILKDALISVWGTCNGLKTYKPINGYKITIPRINAKYIKTYVQ